MKYNADPMFEISCQRIKYMIVHASGHLLNMD